MGGEGGGRVEEGGGGKGSSLRRQEAKWRHLLFVVFRGG